MTKTSAGAFVASSFNPNCSWNAVNKSGKSSRFNGSGMGFVPRVNVPVMEFPSVSNLPS